MNQSVNVELNELDNRFFVRCFLDDGIIEVMLYSSRNYHHHHHHHHHLRYFRYL